MSEVWKPHPELTSYEGSSVGRIRSVDRLVRAHHDSWRPVAGKVIAQTLARTGYLTSSLTVGGRAKTVRVHRFICETFHGMAPFDGAVVRHLDGTRVNNVPSNLCWGTYAENAADATSMGRNSNARKTHCKRGHPYSPENTYRPKWKPNSRICRTCKAAWDGKRKKVDASW